MQDITAFRNEHFFLSNFFPAPVTYMGLTFQNNEAAFQAAKCPEEASAFQNLSPEEAKYLGRRIPLRRDWEQIKEGVMYEICKRKFSQNRRLAQKLIDTEDAILIEGNIWGDTFWGVCRGVGENKLGEILMRIRAELNIEYRLKSKRNKKL